MSILSQLKKLFTKKPKIIVVLGPTSSGKSDLAVEIAKKYHGEIISADSRQVYTGMNLGSGKITKDEMQEIPHYLLDVANPKNRFTAHDFQKLGTQAIHRIQKHKKIPIVCGGTGFYIQQLLEKNNSNITPPNPILRKELEIKNIKELQQILLSKTKGKKYPHIDMQNKVRVIRAIEILEDKGYIPKQKKKSLYNTLYIGLDLPNEQLHNLIHNRILKRIDQGMIEEVKRLKQQGVSNERLYEFGLEYRNINEYLEGHISQTDMIENLYKETCHFVKRQRTWFKKNKNIHWFNPLLEKDKIDTLIKKFLK